MQVNTLKNPPDRSGGFFQDLPDDNQCSLVY